MTTWKADVGNDPEREMSLVIEVQEGDEFRARIERRWEGVVLHMYPSASGFTVPAAWLTSVLQAACRDLDSETAGTEGLVPPVASEGEMSRPRSGVRVYIVHHERSTGDGGEDVKLIGVYSTRGRAEEAVKRLAVLPGFREYLEGFAIDEYRMDTDHWSQGFGVR